MRIPSGSTDRVLYFVAVDATDLKTRETGLSGFTVYRSRNGGAATAYTTPTVTELSAANMPGVYALTIDEDTTIGATHDTEEYVVHVTQAAMAPVTRTCELYRPETTEGTTLVVSATGVGDADVREWAGSTVATTTVAGVPEVDVTHFNGVAGTFAAGRPEVNTTHVGGTAQTAGDIPARLPAALVSGRMDASVGAMAAGVVTATAVATGAIDADALATDAVAEIADAVWDEARAGHVAAGSFGEGVASVTGAVGSVAAGGITAASIATGAVDADALAADAAAEIADAVWDEARSGHVAAGSFGEGVASVQGNVTGTVASVVGAVGSIASGGIAAASFAASAITASAIATDAITAAKIAADAIGASEIASAAANKIADHVLRRSFGSARSSSDGDTVSFRSLLGGLAKLVNKWSISGSTLTVYAEDDTTSLGTQAVTADAAADPITSLDTT